MRAGLLRHRLVVQHKVSSTGDGLGGRVTRWADEFSIWGEVKPMQAWEVVRFGQIQLNVSHHIRTRYDSRITHDKRIKFGERTFEIESPRNPGERNRSIHLIAREVST